LIYLSHTKPDKLYVVSVVRQFMHSSSNLHIDLMNDVLAYLKLSLGKGVIYFWHYHLNIMRYPDSNLVGSKWNRNLSQGIFYMLEVI